MIFAKRSKESSKRSFSNYQLLEMTCKGIPFKLRSGRGTHIRKPPALGLYEVGTDLVRCVYRFNDANGIPIKIQGPLTMKELDSDV